MNLEVIGRPALLLLLWLAPASLPAPAFMKLGDIKGEATEAAHSGWIEVDSFSSGMWAVVDDGGNVVAPPAFGNLNVTKQLDKSSPKLALACARGDVQRTLQLHVTRDDVRGNPVYFEYRLIDVLVSSLQSSGAAGAGRPVESATFNYANVEWSYRQIAEDGTLLSQAQAYWDIPSDTGDEGPGNSPPTISPVAPQVVDPGQPGSFFLHIFDEETPAGDLQLSVVTDRPDLVRNLQLAGTGETRTLGFTTSPLYTGIAAVTVKVSDGTLFRSVSFAVQVGVEATPFEAFLRAYFSPDELLDQVLSSPIGDPDGDDLATVLEFGLGTNPREFTPMQEAVRVTRVNTPEGPAIELHFWRHKDAGKVGPVPWMAPESLRYNQYKQGNPLYTETTQAGENPLYEQVSATIHFGSAEADTHFIRMAVELD